MSAGESLYKGMFTGHASLHLHWNSCPKTQNMHALHCHRLLYAGPYTVAENQLRPCGQRRSWMNLSLFVSIMWVEESKEQPLTCDWVSALWTSSLKPPQGGFKPVPPLDSLQQWQANHGPSSVQTPLGCGAVDHASLFHLVHFKIQLAKNVLKGLCLWTYIKDSQTQEHLWQPHTPVQWQQYWHVGNCQ